MAFRAFKSFSDFTHKYPIVRGMIAYSIIWPLSNITQQLIQERKKFDFKETARYGIYGGLVVGPSVFGWFKFIAWFMPGTGLKLAFKKACAEQILYAPVSLPAFFMGMSLLEGKTWDESLEEVYHKFLPTYKINICFWPIVETLNLRYVHFENRASVSAFVGFFWAIILSYMKQLEKKKEHSQ